MDALAFWVIISLAMLTCAAGAASTGCTKEKAYVTAMKSDLRNMVSAQEAYFADHGRYASDVNEVFRPSTGVTIRIESADATGWRARTTHVQLRGSCTIASKDGEPRCDDQVRRNSRPRPRTPLAISVDLWLFAFSVRRRQIRVTRQGAPYV
jgi:hypothetical protein